MIKRIPVPMDAGRVCDAIAKIGYSPTAAVMDIVDNSIAAGATNVVIEIEVDLSGNKTFTTKNNVLTYRIIDNGKGMTDEDMVDALRLGSKAEYEENSLSKYGMGLKSAGFSLGTKIQLISKKNGSFSSINYVDRDEISEAGEYIVSQKEFIEADNEFYVSKLTDFDNGTIVEITGCQRIEQNSAKKTRTELYEKLGVVYYEFFKKPENPLSITIKFINTKEPELKIEPFDILFSDLAKKEGYDPDEYDFKLPVLMYDDQINLPGDETTPPVNLEIVVFPAAEMANYGEFSKEEKEKISAYKIKRENKGFFIYRNDRLIRWGDNFNNGVPRDDHNFRARLVINTAHDEILHVDVSKQNLTIPEDLEQVIKEIIKRGSLPTARAIRKRCTELIKLRTNGDEGTTFSERNQDLSEEDPEEPIEQEKTEAVKKRKEEQATQTEETLKEEGEEELTDEKAPTEEPPVFRRVRYSDKISSMNLWEANVDPVYGVFVRINKNHPYYSTVLANLNEGDESRQSIEAIIWACAVSESLTSRNLTDIDVQIISKILNKFKRVMSVNLDGWCGENSDLYGSD